MTTFNQTPSQPSDEISQLIEKFSLLKQKIQAQLAFFVLLPNPEAQELITQLKPDLDTQIQEIQKQITELKLGQNSDVQGQVSEFIKKIAESQEKITELVLGQNPVPQDRVKQLNGTITILRAEIQKKDSDLLALLPTLDPQEREKQLNQFSDDIGKSGKEIQEKLDELASLPNPDYKVQLEQLTPKIDSLSLEVKNKLNEFALVIDPITQIHIAGLTTKIDGLIKEIRGKFYILTLGNNPDSNTQVLEINKEIDTVTEEIKKQLDGFTYILNPTIKIRIQVLHLERRIDRLIKEIQSKIATFPPELNREVQSEIAKLIKLLGLAKIKLQKKQYFQDFVATQNSVATIERMVDYIEVAINALNNQPNLVLSQKLRHSAKSIEREINGGFLNKLADWRDGFFDAIKTPTKVLIGLIIAIPLSWFIVNGFRGISTNISIEVLDINKLVLFRYDGVKGLFKHLPETTLQSQTDPLSKDEITNILVLLWMTGTLGGAISILTRLESFQTQKYEDDFLPFLVGAVKPFLGSSFGFFLFLLISSKILPIDLDRQDGNNPHLFWYGVLTLAFVGGFSERFVPDLISQVRGNYIPQQETQGQGIPTSSPVLTITPNSDILAYGQSKDFTIEPSGDYNITLAPQMGMIAAQSSSQFSYQAPTKEEAAGITEAKIIITSKTDSTQKAIVPVNFM